MEISSSPSAAAETEGGGEERNKTEGWLYLIRTNRFGLQLHSSRKRYFVLQGNALNCFKSVPSSNKEQPIRRAIIDSCIRVSDDGRENIHRKVLFIFTLYSSSNHNDQLKLGARSSEEAARWIHSLKEVALKECPNQGEDVTCSLRKWQYFRLSRNRRNSHMNSLDQNWNGWTSAHAEPITADVIAPSPWKIFGCHNGLRLFVEARERDSHCKYGDHPAIMAVCAIDATSEAIFQTIMSLGPSRSEWDFCVSRAAVIEHLDGHSDIIHKQMNSDWLPRGMKRRDLLMRRYWRREDDGTYVILYHSVFHKKCLPQKGYVRACIKSGGYVITPLNDGKRSVVKHMLAIDWKYWKSYLFTSCARKVTMRMLERIAALREMFKTKVGSTPIDFSSGELGRQLRLPQNVKDDTKVEVGSSTGNKQSEKSQTGETQDEPYASPANLTGSFLELSDAADEFFDVPEQSEFDRSDPDSDGTSSPEDAKQSQIVDENHPKPSPAAVLVKRLHDLAVQRKHCIDFREVAKDGSPCCFGSTLLRDSSCATPCSWTTADPSTFLIRGKHYLQDRQKIKAKSTSMQMVGADWLKSDRREDDIAGRPGSFIQKYAAQGGDEFFFIVNIQVPGSTTYSLVLYYMMDSPLEETPLLERFVKGDDAYRNSRFKLIPYISKGSWIVKQSVGKKACLVGQALEINYFHGKNYLELGVDIGSSTVARGVVSLVLGYLNHLVIEMAFLIQGNTVDELPEFLLGTCRLNHLDAAKSVPVRP